MNAYPESADFAGREPPASMFLVPIVASVVQSTALPLTALQLCVFSNSSSIRRSRRHLLQQSMFPAVEAYDWTLRWESAWVSMNRRLLIGVDTFAVLPWK